MSYILDALKKSEQERGHGHIPSVQTVHTSSLNYSNKQTYWPYFVATIVLLNLAAIFYFYLNNNATHVANTNADATSNRNNATPPISAQRPVEPATNTTPVRMNTLPVQQSAHIPADTTSSHQHVSTLPAANRSIRPTNKPIVFDSNNAQNYNAALSSQETRSSESINPEIIEYYDLPESTRRRLPSISVSAHVYSDNPLQRSIVVNNDYLEEGERILDDLILQEITSDGAIMNYRGTVFHYEIVSGWQ